MNRKEGRLLTPALSSTEEEREKDLCAGPDIDNRLMVPMRVKIEMEAPHEPEEGRGPG